METRALFKALVMGVALATVSGLPATALGSRSLSPEPTEKAANTQDAKAVAIIEKSIELLGGAEKISKHTTMHAKGTMSLPAMGLTGTLETYLDSPDHFLLSYTFPAMGESKQGLGDGVAWSVDAMSGPRLLSEEEAKVLKQEADVTSSLRFKELYPTIEYVEQTTFDNKAAHKLRLVDADGKETINYYGVDEGYALGSEQTVASPMGPAKTTTMLRDYKELGGMMQPTTMVQKIGPTEIFITITSAEYGEIDDSVFELPAPVKALVEASKENASQKKDAPSDSNG